jgi:hypothetical protein
VEKDGTTRVYWLRNDWAQIQDPHPSETRENFQYVQQTHPVRGPRSHDPAEIARVETRVDIHLCFYGNHLDKGYIIQYVAPWLAQSNIPGLDEHGYIALPTGTHRDDEKRLLVEYLERLIPRWRGLRRLRRGGLTVITG